MEAQLPPDQVVRPSRGPIRQQLEEGQVYYWCSCGRSQNQPFCDGSHSGTAFQPVEFRPDATKRYALCGCKATQKRPLCDGSHSTIEWQLSKIV